MAARETGLPPNAAPQARRRRRPALLIAAGVLASALWGGLFVVLDRAGEGGRPILDGLLLLLPLAGIWLAVIQAASLAALRAEADTLRRDLARARTTATQNAAAPSPERTPPPDDQGTPADGAPDPVAQAPAAPIPTGAKPSQGTAPPTPRVGATTPAPGPAPAFASVRGGNAAGAQGNLPLRGGSEPPPPLPQADLIRALHFPETPDDTEGFRSLRRALRDPLAGQVIQAAQDVLTLLSKDGLYMDDLDARPPPPGLWRRFAEGERSPDMAAMAGINDPDALALCVGRMRADAVLRDAAHHFLHRFDRMLAETAAAMDDDALAALSQTRSARAFMLLGQAARMFD